MMDPNAATSVVDKILQNPQNWISFLTLIFTIIIGSVTILSVILGFFTAKRHLELREEHLSVREQIQEENLKLRKTREEYDSLAREMRVKLNIAISGPDIEKNRELLDACVVNLREDAQLAKSYTDTIVPALYCVSETGTIEDVKRLLRIMKLAQKRGNTKLVAAAADALKRLGLD